jgi:hypothetical protein
VTDASDDGLRLQNVRTEHNVRLNPDNIHNYQSDPSGDRDGFLMLDLQLILHGNRVRYEPLDPRGNVTFIPVDRIQEGPPLDTEEKDLLVSCLSSNDGLLHIFDADQLGQWVTAGAYHFVDQKDRAVASAYRSAVVGLLVKGLVTSVEGPTTFELTDKGFNVARALTQKQWSINVKFLNPTVTS